MCQGKTEPFEKLCELFNEETKNGEEVELYTNLLKKAVKEIIRIFKKRTTQKLFTDRGALLIPKSKQVHDLDNFELITLLIIK